MIDTHCYVCIDHKHDTREWGALSAGEQRATATVQCCLFTTNSQPVSTHSKLVTTGIWKEKGRHPNLLGLKLFANSLPVGFCV